MTAEVRTDGSLLCFAASLSVRTMSSPAAQSASAPSDFAAESLTYRELDRRANRLANRLRKLGVGLESRVGMMMDRSPGLVTTLLGILKAELSVAMVLTGCNRAADAGRELLDAGA